MSLSTNSLSEATAALSRSFAASQSSMSEALERVGTGKRFTRASQDFAGYSKAVDLDVNIPYDCMDLVSLAHEEGEVYSIKYYEKYIHIRASIPYRLSGRFEKKAIDVKK